MSAPISPFAGMGYKNVCGFAYLFCTKLQLINTTLLGFTLGVTVDNKDTLPSGKANATAAGGKEDDGFCAYVAPAAFIGAPTKASNLEGNVIPGASELPGKLPTVAPEIAFTLKPPAGCVYPAGRLVGKANKFTCTAYCVGLICNCRKYTYSPVVDFIRYRLLLMQNCCK